jgi:peptidoglycan/xylan/chitin deacetylase (PgdA/CDA1 family)
LEGSQKKEEPGLSLQEKAHETLAPPDFVWPGGKSIAVTYMIAYEGWSAGKAPGIGPMGNPLPPGNLDTNALSWGEYGARRGIWRILKMLERLQVRATVMVCGVLAERFPDSVKAIADGGHEIAAHSYAMDVLPVLLSEDQERENIARTTELIEKACGIRPRGWISPRGTPSVNTGRLLAEAGYTWHGDSLSDDLPSLLEFGGKALVNVPFTMDINDLPSLIRYGNPPSQMVDVFKASLDYLDRHRDDVAKIDVTIHAHVFGRPSGIWTYEEIIKIAQSANNIFSGTRDQIVSHFKSLLAR